VAESQQKQMKDIMKDLNKSGRMLGKSIGLMEGAIAATTKAAKESNKIVNDKFKTLTETLGLQKKSNVYYKAANNITKKLSDNSKKLTKSEKEQLELHRKQLNIMGKLDDVASDITEQFGMQASAIKNGVKQARLLLNPIVALSGVLALSVKRFFDLEKLGKGTARESGLLAMNTTDFANKIADVQPELIAFGASIEDISKASSAVADNFGVLTSETADIVSESVKVGAAFGVQADTMVNVVSEARLLGATMKDISMFTDDVINSGVQVNKVFEDLKAVQGDTALILAGQTNQLMSQVLEARKLGLNLNDIANSTSATGSFQDMFTSQMKASVLFGRSINLVESTRLRRQGKFLEARRRELTSLTGTTDLAQQALRIEGMSVEQKKELERITGRTASDTIKDLNRQLLLQGKLTGDAKRIAESELKREQLLQRQLNLQDKLSAIFSRLSIKIGEQLLPVITTFGNYLENLLDEPGKLNEILDTTVGYLKTAFGILVAMKGISFAGSVASLFGGVGGGRMKDVGMMTGLFGKGQNIGGRFTQGGGRIAAGTMARGAGASALRVLGPAAAAISVGADVFKLATTNDAKERKKALGGTIGGALGGGLGFFLGGPAGLAIGAGLGQFAGKAIGKFFADEVESKQDTLNRVKSGIDFKIANAAFDREIELGQKIKEIQFKGAQTREEILDNVFAGLKGTELANTDLSGLVDTFFQFGEDGKLAQSGDEFLKAIDGFKNALNDQATEAIKDWAAATKLTAESAASSDLLKKLDRQKKGLQTVSEGALLGNENAVLAQFGTELNKLLTDAGLDSSPDFAKFQTLMGESKFVEAEKRIKLMEDSVAKTLEFDAGSLAAQNVVKRLALQAGLTPEQLRSSEGLASVQKTDFRKSRFMHKDAGIRSDLLTDSVKNALEIIGEQVDRERVEEETRILSSDEFNKKMDELINAVQTSGGVTIGAKVIKEIHKGVVNNNQTNN
tara:strand:- start:414 stop:3323 length:2910 start_codon:yes stop_codon:yes gene_type:complete